MKQPAPRRSRPLVGILMGSDSDRAVMEEAAAVLREAGVSFEMRILSAHRSPRETSSYAASAARKGIRVLIAGAGGAAHLAGAVAAHTTLPVIGVPLDATALEGTDAFVSTLQMPPGVPVATMSIGRWGARNAGILALQILALQNRSLARYLARFKGGLRKSVLEKDRRLR